MTNASDVYRKSGPQNWSRTSELLSRISRTLALLCFLSSLVNFCTAGPGTEVTCPWLNDENVADELKNGCVCAKNPPTSSQLSVQCHEVDGHQLVALLSERVTQKKVSVGLLYLNASLITDEDGQLPENVFQKLRLISLQLSNCMIQTIHTSSFHGLEKSLKHLSLTQNQIAEVPTAAVSPLSNLLLLDLSFNKLEKVKAGAFQNLHKLSTLKLNDNSMELDTFAFTGLEKTLKNLNLKGTRLSGVPSAIVNLTSLAFLDLAQNRIRQLEKNQFSNLHSLTALNLERNLLQSLPSAVFSGVNDTLSSLSLLNNLITHYPTSALRSLKELRVLDVGFNLLTEIPHNSFSGLNSLTLLALDGNPLATLPEVSFRPINNTLRGISIGGRFLNCDCRLRWIFEWMDSYDLQVTSRERNPQFCGSPSSFRTMTFQQINPNELVCIKNSNNTTSKEKVTPALPKEVTVLSIDTPMAVLQFDNSTGSEDQAASESTMVRDVTTEMPMDPVTEYRNPNQNNDGSRFRFRRPRPRPRTSTAKPVFISSTERFGEHDRKQFKPHSQQSNEQTPQVDSLENNDAEEESKETQNSNNNHGKTEETLARPETKFVKPLPPNRSDMESFRRQEPTSLPFSTTTRKYPSPSSLKTLRSFQQSSREAAAARLSTSTETSVSVSTMTSSSSMVASSTRYEDATKVPLIRAKPPTPMTITPKPMIINNRPNSAVVRKASIDTKDYDESKIPIISGVGPTRHNSDGNGGSNNNNGNSNGSPSIIKSPPPGSVQTQGVLVVQPSSNIPQSHSPHSPHSPGGIGNPRSPSLIFAEKSDIVIRDIQRTSDSIMLRWESLKHLPGYRIIYRLFGEDAFRHGPPLAPTEREYRIKHIPFNECVVVCVVPYDDILYNEINPNAGSVPPGSQCRELKPTTPSVLMNHMDKITIGASAAICATVIIAVLLFIAITRKSKGKRSPSASTLVSKVPPSIMTPSPGPPGMHHQQGSMNMIKDWDQLSAVSARSIPRPRVYHGSLDHLAQGTTHRQSMIIAPNHRSVPDGHSTHRSYLSAHHHHHNHSVHAYHHNNNHGNHGGGNHGHGHGHGHHAPTHGNAFMHTQGRPVRQSMMSVRSSHDTLNAKPFTHGPHNHSHRHFEQNHKRKRAGRPSQSESLNTLSGYDTPDNWTDHDMDVYVARNHARHDLVQL